MEIERNVRLSNKNWFGTGGYTNYFAEPVSIDDLNEALDFAKKNNLEVFVLGTGANILISDDGFDGLVIRPALKKLEIIKDQNVESQQPLVRAGSGVEISELIEYCLENNIVGLEEFSGIPGTVGGSVYINIHYFEYLLSDFLVSATVIHKETGEISKVDNEWFGFGYDESKLFENKYILLDATFKVREVTRDEAIYAKGRSDEIIRHRARRYPTSHTCGSFFRNFHEDEVSLEIGGKKMTFIAYYLDKLGVKGVLSSGGAIVSYQHANMLVNQGNATSQDIIDLARKMQQLVQDEYGITPQPECQLIGFKEYPLLS